MPPALHRGLARPSALTFLVHRPFRPARPYAVSSRRTRLPASLPIDGVADIRQELESAQKHNPHDALHHGDKLPHSDRKNFLARLTSWLPLFKRLKDSPDAFGTFRHEADVCNRLPVPESTERRLVDQARYSQSVDLWLEILRFRLRLDGHQGVMDVVQAIVNRNIILPLHGPQADSLWSLLLWSAVQYPQLLRLLYPYLVETLPRSGLHTIRLYQRVVIPLLRQNPMFAASWHKRMQADNLLPNDPVPLLAQLVEHACLSTHKSRAIDAFKKIYAGTGVKSLYDECMLRLCRLSDFATAVDMHAFFIRHGDHPSPQMRLTPLVVHLAENAWLAKSSMKPSSKARFADQLANAQHDFHSLKPSISASSPAPTVPPLTRESMSTIVGDVHNIREKELNDAFCARLFATTAFSTDLIISGLRMLGLKAVGNLALREIAARAPAPTDYITTVDAIKASGISVVNSVFSRALHSFAARPDKHQSFDFLITSDQHPSAYEDRRLQKQLFGSFLDSGAHEKANAVLDVLTLDEPDPDFYHANLILQVYTRRGKRAAALQILNEMRLHRIQVSEASLRFIQWIALRNRARSKKPITQQHHLFEDDLDFTTNVFLETMRTGQSLDPSRWREILRRYGMQNRFEALERLSIWLALWYSDRFSDVARPILMVPSGRENLSRDRRPSSTLKRNSQHPLDMVFTQHLLRAIIAWGFKSDVSSPESRTPGNLSAIPEFDLRGQKIETGATKNSERWARGLALIRKLRRLGVSTAHKELRRETKLRLWILYGPGRSTVPANRLAQKNNKIPLVHRVRHIHDIMGKNWFKLPLKFQGQTKATDWAMYRALFSQPRRMRRRRTRKTRG